MTLWSVYHTYVGVIATSTVSYITPLVWYTHFIFYSVGIYRIAIPWVFTEWLGHLATKWLGYLIVWCACVTSINFFQNHCNITTDHWHIIGVGRWEGEGAGGESGWEATEVG